MIRSYITVCTLTISRSPPKIKQKNLIYDEILIQWLRPPRDLTVVDEPVPDPDPEPFVDTLPDPLLPK